MSFKMQKRRKRVVLALWVSLIMVVVGLWGMIGWAKKSTPRPDYQEYNLDKPWFDGKSWPWFLDMFDQPHLKPQEEGSFQNFPIHSVPRSGREAVISATALVNGQPLRDLIPENPTSSTAESVERGKVMYDTFCVACHGAEGMSNAPVAKKGMPAVPIKPLLKALSEAHLYNKIRYGGPIMPPYGAQLLKAERWDLVNYLKSNRFGQAGR